MILRRVNITQRVNTNGITNQMIVLNTRLTFWMVTGQAQVHPSFLTHILTLTVFLTVFLFGQFGDGRSVTFSFVPQNFYPKIIINQMKVLIQVAVWFCRGQIDNICWIIEKKKQENSRKTFTSASQTMIKSLCGSQKTAENS